MGKLLKRPWFALRHALAIGTWAVLLAALSSLASQSLLKEITVVGISLGLLLFVIVIGIVFDIIGVAVATATEPPLHARAARRVPGAQQALQLVRRAHSVASFCNDVVGDVCGTLSGAIGTTIVFQVLYGEYESVRGLGTTLMTAVIAGLVVGGKGYGKAIAIEDGTQIIFHCGQLLCWVERLLHVRLFKRLPQCAGRSGNGAGSSDRRRPRPGKSTEGR